MLFWLDFSSIIPLNNKLNKKKKLLQLTDTNRRKGATLEVLNNDKGIRLVDLCIIGASAACVELLALRGVDLLYRSTNGTPMAFAAKKGYLDIVEVLRNA